MSVPLAAGPWPAVEALAAIGGWWGAMPLNRKRFERALLNVRQAFPTWTDAQVQRCGQASYEHIFRLAAEFLYIPRLINEDNWPSHLEIPVGLRQRPNAQAQAQMVHQTQLFPANIEIATGTNADPKVDITMPLDEAAGAGPALDILLSRRRCILLTGHCGNWELLAYIIAAVGFPMHAVYRPLDNPALDQWVRSTRGRRGVTLLDKFGAANRINEVLAEGHPLAFVADQNAGDRGLFVPYFGRLTSTYKAIGLLAIKHNAPVMCAAARRLKGPEAWRDGGGFRYRMEVTDVIEPDAWKNHPDPLFYITARYRRALEQMVRKAPEQYLWMHRMWKSRPRHERDGKPVPKAQIEKLRTLPWMTAAEIDRVIDDSERSAVEFAREAKARTTPETKSGAKPGAKLSSKAEAQAEPGED